MDSTALVNTAGAASALTSWFFSTLEANSLIVRGAAPEEVLKVLEAPNDLLRGLRLHGESVLGTLWRFHHQGVAVCLEKYPDHEVVKAILPGVAAPFRDGFLVRSLSEGDLVTRYFGGLHGLLEEGARLFHGKWPSWSWEQVMTLEDRASRLMSLDKNGRKGARYYHDLRKVSLDLAQAGLKNRAVQVLERWSQDMDRAEQSMTFAETLAAACLGEAAVPFFKELLPTIDRDDLSAVSVTDGLRVVMAHVEASGLGEKAWPIFEMLVSLAETQRKSYDCSRLMRAFIPSLGRLAFGSMAESLYRRLIGLARGMTQTSDKNRIQCLADIAEAMAEEDLTGGVLLLNELRESVRHCRERGSDYVRFLCALADLDSIEGDAAAVDRSLKAAVAVCSDVRGIQICAEALGRTGLTGEVLLASSVKEVLLGTLIDKISALHDDQREAAIEAVAGSISASRLPDETTWHLFRSLMENIGRTRTSTCELSLVVQAIGSSEIPPSSKKELLSAALDMLPQMPDEGRVSTIEIFLEAVRDAHVGDYAHGVLMHLWGDEKVQNDLLRSPEAIDLMAQILMEAETPSSLYTSSLLAAAHAMEMGAFRIAIEASLAAVLGRTGQEPIAEQVFAEAADHYAFVWDCREHSLLRHILRALALSGLGNQSRPFFEHLARMVKATGKPELIGQFNEVVGGHIRIEI